METCSVVLDSDEELVDSAAEVEDSEEEVEEVVVCAALLEVTMIGTDDVEA